jgi:hypothetical protein
VRVPISILALIAVGGCSSLIGVSPDVNYEIVVAAVVRDCDAPPAQYTDPATAMEVGFAKVQASCEAFFVDATRAQQNALAADRSLDLGLVGATAIINATNPAAAAAKAITITAAGIVLSKGLIDEYTKIYAFNTHLYKVREITTKTMEDYIIRSRASPPRNYCLAYTYVQKLATLCTLAALKANLDGQVALNSNIQNNNDVEIAPGRPAASPRSSPSRVQSRSSGPPSASYKVVR